MCVTPVTVTHVTLCPPTAITLGHLSKIINICYAFTVTFSNDFKVDSIQFKVVYFQHNTQYIQQCFFAYDVLKRERAEDRADVGSFTQLLIGDNDLNNHNGYCSCNVIAKLQTYNNKE